MAKSRGVQFFLQQVVAVLAAPLGGLLAVVILQPVLAALGIPLRHTLQGVFAVIIYAIGLPAGYFIPRARNRGLQLARWTWVLPVVAFLLLFIDEARRFGLQYATAAFFNPRSEDSEGLAAVFFTLPTASAIGYSIGSALHVLVASRLTSDSGSGSGTAVGTERPGTDPL